MELLNSLIQAIAALLTALAALCWPILVIVALLVFRKETQQLFYRLKSGEVPGVKFELLDRLEAEATTASVQVAALPHSQSTTEEQWQAIQDNAGLDLIRQILEITSRSPKAGLLLLASEIERELRTLLSIRGYKPYRTVREGFSMLEGSIAIPTSVSVALDLFWSVRNQIVHGLSTSTDDILRAIDSGITILRTLQSISRETYTIYYPGVPVYEDRQCQQERVEVKGIILETTSAEQSYKYYRILPTTRIDLQKGKQVVADIGYNKFGASWYKDPDTGEIKSAWADNTYEVAVSYIEDF